MACAIATTLAHGAPLTVADAFTPPTLAAVALSPDGAYLVARVYSKDRGGVLLIDAATLESKALYASDSIFGAPLTVRWVGAQLVAVQTLRGIVTLSLDGSVQRTLAGRMLTAIPGARPGHEMLVVDDSGYFKKVGARSAADESVSVDLPVGAHALIFDDQGVARVASVQRTAVWSDETTVTYWYRSSEADDWKLLESFQVTDIAWKPFAVSKDGHSLIVSSRAGRDTLAMFRYDIETRRITDLLAGHPREDIASLDEADDESFLWVKTSGLMPTIHWFDASGAALQRAVDTALPGRINTLVGRSGERALVYSYGDVDPGAWYLLDVARSSLKLIASVNSHVKPEEMLPVRTVTYRSVDGLDIPAYLTLPAGGGKSLPAVVLVHGGPVARDAWGFDAEVQLLASRGYAVLQPQFRGSRGFGKAFEEAGYNQWGRAMQDDVTAGTQWLIDQGIADATRICIYGASYGGYAAMWAMVKTPSLFRCGVSVAGVSDLNELFADGSDVARSATGRLFQRATIGDPESMRVAFEEVSPLKHAAEFGAPVLIAHGDRDQRVPESHSKSLVAALRANHKPVEWIELPDEGHSLAKPKNQEVFFEALFKFLDRHIGSVSKESP